MVERWQYGRLKHNLEYRRGVYLSGVRQSGKSTLAKMLNLENSRHYTLDDKSIRTVAEQDPRGFVRHDAGETLVIDEIQKVPVQ